MLIYRIKHRDTGEICSSMFEEKRARQRLSEANQGVYNRSGWPKGQYFIEIVEFGRENFDNEVIF